ncbi:MAG: hypothetical protein ACYDGL_00045 [Bellilinea sp.]
MSSISASTDQAKPRFTTPIHVAFWLLVNPSGWRAALDEIDPTLPIDFSITSLNPQQRKNRNLWRFLVYNYLLLISMSTLAVLIVLNLSEASRPVIIQSVWLTFGYSLILPLVMGYAFSVGSGMVFAGLIALGIGLLARQTDFFFLPVALAGGLTGCVLLNRSRDTRLIFRGRHIIGLLAGFISAGILLSLGVLIVSGKIFGFSLGNPGGAPLHDPFAQIIAITSGVLYAIAFTIAVAAKAHKSFWRSLPAGVIAGMILAISYYFFVRSEENSAIFLISAAIGAGLLMSLLFTIPWLLTDWVGGPQAAAVAAAVITGVSWVRLGSYLVVGFSENQANYFWALLTVGIGLSFSTWRPILLLPFVSVWNNFLYSLERGKKTGPLKFFRLHSVFWEEGQLIHWPGLDEYLLLQAERDPQEYEKNAVMLAHTPQRGIVQSVEIELITRKFEDCADLFSIAEVYKYTQSKFLDGPAAIILRTFFQMSRDAESALNLPTVYQSRLALGRLRSDLNLFQRELFFSNHPYTQWFTSVLAKWDRIFESHINHLTQESSFQQEIVNPYICGMPLNNEQEVFVGRTDIMARIERLLTDPNRPPLHLFGQRRMGKTSLLLNLDHYLPSSMICVFLDGQALGGYRDTGEVFAYIIEEIRSKTYRQHGLKLPQLHLDEDPTSDYSRISKWVDTVEKILDSQHLYILTMLDEFEALTLALQEAELKAQDFLGLARFMIQHRPHFKSLYVGSHSLDEIGLWSTFLFNAQVVKVGRLAPVETLRLIENPVKNFNLKYDPIASQRILNLTSGHPHLVQSVCFELVMIKNEQPGSRRFLVTLPDVEEAVKRSLSSISFFFADIRGKQINPETMSMLDYLADKGENEVVAQGEWAARFPTHFDRNLALALKRDLVEQVDGGFKFQVEMIRRWFAERPF